MRFLCLILTILILLVLNIMVGSVSLPFDEMLDALFSADVESTTGFIIFEHRLPMALTAIFGGATLAASGLLLQTAFRNPLAGPSVLGINSGASLGVALVMLAFGGTLSAGSLTLGGRSAVMAAAFFGSMAIMGLLLMLSTLLRNSLMLLISGIMIGYLTSSVITLLNYASDAAGIQSYVLWGMSSFSGVTRAELPLFTFISLLGLFLSLLLIKPLNLLGLGDNYAANLGVNLRSTRNLLLLTTGLLTAAATAYCGPVSFIGLSVPHIARLIFPTDNHRLLLPATILTGAAIGLACNLMCVAFTSQVLPLNAVTPLVGAPVVIYILLRGRR